MVRLRRVRVRSAAAFLLYLALSLLFFGRHAIAHPSTVCACVGNGDPTSYMWSLSWWPHAIGDGLNPLHPDVIWAPDGVNLTQGAVAMPAVSVALAPVTLAAGPVVAYNVASVLMPVLGAWFAYRLCRYLTGAFAPSLLGGFVFGFATYISAHLLGHLNLAATFLLPAAVHVVLLRLDEAISRRRFALLMCLLFALQLLLSAELLLTGIGFGALALLLGYITADGERRRRIRGLGPPVLVGGLIAMAVTSPYLYWTLKGLGDADSDAWKAFTALYPADALNVIVPTAVTGLGHWWFKGTSAKFTLGTTSEAAAYVGPVLLAITIGYAITRWRRPTTPVLIGVVLVSYILSLGTKLRIAGHATEVPLPWKLLNPLPVLNHVTPVRLFLFASLPIAIMVALWLAEDSRRRALKWVAAGVGVALLVPNLSASFWQGRPTQLAFFTSDAYKAHLRKDEMALVLPFGRAGSSMLWQAEAKMHFRMPEGYVSPEYPPEYRSDPFLPVLLSTKVNGNAAPGLRDFIRRRGVTAVLVEPSEGRGWQFVLGSLRLRPVMSGGMLVYRLPVSWGTAR
jgi:hypothetical protein